ncbi:MFS transporter [Polyangium aurulentum]|uniref:MFS transporter n=1 Tax=Polyangium aurulentum TaxID=2567896 RepID=UPI00146E8D81|nr:MFS transporter [Polyangium aurulentum]UQA56120.1 MFS transporter [Polyangium aurulentum]
MSSPANAAPIEGAPSKPEKFPPTFYYANAIELLERLAHYGMYIGLTLYLTKIVGFDDTATGDLTALFRSVGSFWPILAGAIADRIGFRRALVVAFSLYALGYAGLFGFPVKALAPVALIFCAIAGGFMKPVITGTVVRTAPEGRQTEGFAVFYRMVNSGSVVGKTLAYFVRVMLSLRYVMVTSVIASLGALVLAIFGYKEPERGKVQPKGSFADEIRHLARGWVEALSNVRFTAFLVIFAGFYFMIEQFYMTLPKYVTRHIDAKAPLEIITLVNPAFIALFQGVVTKATKQIKPVTTMMLGVILGALSMLVMGIVPGILGTVLSCAIFAFAEMTFSPRFYDYIASFAPPGRTGMYMGLAFVPAVLGSALGGVVSGRMIARYLPEDGARSPLAVWGTYAALGLVCGAAMLVYRKVFPPPQDTTAEKAAS